MKDVDIDEIACLKEGCSLCESKSALRDLMMLSPDEIDYEKLKRKEESESNVYVDNVEQDIGEEDCDILTICLYYHLSLEHSTNILKT